MMNCEEIQQLLEAYTLGVLDASEREMVERHMGECADCRRRAMAYAEVVNLFPQALSKASPIPVPASLKERLLQSLEDPIPTSPQPTDDSRPQPMALKAYIRQRFFWSRPRALVLFAVVLISVISLAWNAHLSVALAKERSLRAEFADLVDQQELVLEVIDSDRTTKVILRSPNEESTSYGKLYTRSDMQHAVVMAARLPQPPAGQAYHFWVTEGGQPKPVGVLKINNQGFGMLVFDTGRDGPVYEAAQLTLQLLDSQMPSGKLVLQWEASP